MVEQEEAGQPERADHAQLLLQAGGRLASLERVRVAVAEPRAAQLGELAVGVGVLGAGIAVAEVAREVELEPLREPLALEHRVGVVAKALGHLGGRRHHRAGVAAPLGLGLVERSSAGGPRRTRPGGGRGRGGAQCTLPVATHGTPSRCASSASARLRMRSWRQNGRCSSTRKRSRPKAAQQPPADPLGLQQIAALDPPGERTVARASREADEPLGVALELLEA